VYCSFFCNTLCTDPGILDLQVEKVCVVTGLSTRDFESNSSPCFGVILWRVLVSLVGNR
jgi:hypothetical protein